MGFDIIGMTALPEAKLAREAEMCFGMLATVTDYDVWREEEVTIETVINNVKRNAATTQRIIEEFCAPPPNNKQRVPVQARTAGRYSDEPEAISDEVFGKASSDCGKVP